MSDDADEKRRELRLRFGVALGARAIKLFARTWRIRTTGAEHVARMRAAGQPFVFCLWHGQMLPLLWQHRGEGIAILISSHRDGEIIARIAHALGYRTIRGSTSRGGGRALLGLVRALQDGVDDAVTPDGPRGPAEKFAPGALMAAQRGKAPIIAIVATAKSAWRLRSWDRFLIPRPFARVHVAYSEPTYVDATTLEGIGLEASRFEVLLRDTIAAAGG